MKKKVSNKYLKIFYAKNLKKVLGNSQDKIIQVCSPSLIFFIQFVSPFPLVCLNILLGLRFVSVSVDVAFYFKLGFGKEGRGFESGSWFFLGGVCFFKMEFCWGWGVGVVLL